MKCLKCSSDYSGDPRSYYCSKVCRKSAENDRARLKRLMKAFPRTMAVLEQAEKDGDYLRANRAKSKLARIEHQIDQLKPVHTNEKGSAVTVILYNAIGRVLERQKTNLPKNLP